MKFVATLSLLLLVASASASSVSQQDQVSSSVSTQNQQQAQGSVVQPSVVPSNSPVVESVVSNVEQPQVAPQQHQVVHHHQQQQPPVASYYAAGQAPAGLIQVVGNEQQVAGPKPVGSRNFEQYGQPESSGLPPNYKPFGSWGLYIGGNPADGYYTNYYKALSSSVTDKQQVSGIEPAVQGAKPVGVSQTAALSPVLRQASSSPYVGQDGYYPFAYSPNDLNSGARVAVESPVVHSSVHQVSGVVSPVAHQQGQAGVFGVPGPVYESSPVYPSPYSAELYATKKVGTQASYAQKEPQREAQVQATVSSSSPKGYQPRVYVYQPPQAVVGQLAAPQVQQSVASQQAVVSNQQQQQQAVVAYPVPVGSQIVGSQVGVDGAFAPYGVHAFTRYAVKPTVVNQDPSYYYSVHAPNNVPSYKQQVYSNQIVGTNYYPLAGHHYAYPVVGSPLHYSQGQVVPQVVGGNVEQHGPVQPVLFENVSEKQVEDEKNKVQQ